MLCISWCLWYCKQEKINRIFGILIILPILQKLLKTFHIIFLIVLRAHNWAIICLGLYLLAYSTNLLYIQFSILCNNFSISKNAGKASMSVHTYWLRRNVSHKLLSYSATSIEKVARSPKPTKSWRYVDSRRARYLNLLQYSLERFREQHRKKPGNYLRNIKEKFEWGEWQFEPQYW